MHILHFTLRDSIMKINCERSAGVVIQWSRLICLTQIFKLYLRVPKKFVSLFISMLYIGMYSIYTAGKLCRCEKLFYTLSRNVTSLRRLSVVVHNPRLWRGCVTSRHITKFVTFVMFDWDSAIPQQLPHFLPSFLCYKF